MENRVAPWGSPFSRRGTPLARAIPPMDRNALHVFRPTAFVRLMHTSFEFERWGPSLAWVVRPFDMRLQFVGPEVDGAQVARRVALGFVVEVRRLRIAALAADGDRARADLLPELDDGDEAVAAGAVVPLGARPSMGAERRERAPARGDEGYRDAWLGIIEHLGDRAVDALEAVDFAPRHTPVAEVLLQPVGRLDQRVQPHLRPGFFGHVVVDGRPLGVCIAMHL